MMKLAPYDMAKNPEYVDIVIAALLAESSELEDGVDRVHVRKLLQAGSTVQCLVATQDEELLGTIIITISPLWYNPSVRCARDLLVWVAPAHRGGTTFVRMLKELEAWASRVGIKKLYLSQTTGIEVDKTARLYEKLGYLKVGFLTAKRIG